MKYVVDNLQFENCIVCTSTPDFFGLIESFVNDGTAFYVDTVLDSENCFIPLVYY